MADTDALRRASPQRRRFVKGQKPQTHQDVVRLDIGVENVAAFEQLESQEQLLAVGAHGLDVQAHVLPVLLQHLAQVHAAEETEEQAISARGLARRAGCGPASRLPEGLKHETQVLLVVEMPEEAETVELVVRVGVIQLLEELQLFQTRLLPARGLLMNPTSMCLLLRWRERLT